MKLQIPQTVCPEIPIKKYKIKKPPKESYKWKNVNIIEIEVHKCRSKVK